MSETVRLFCVVFVILIAVTMHEFSHAFVAKLFGDSTAEKEGRLSMNPLHHLDPMGSIFVPAILYLMNSPMLFGWARPVPIDPRQFTKQRLGSFCVAFAGPLMNLFLAWLSAVFLHFNSDAQTLGNEVMERMIGINCVLAAFNLLPIPPLDGSRMVSALLPSRAAFQYNKIEPIGGLILLSLILIPKLFHLPSPLQIILLPITHSFIHTIQLLSGHF